MVTAASFVAVLAIPPMAQAISFGIGDSQGAFNNYYDSCWFQALTTTGDVATGPYCPVGHTGPVGYVRFPVPWDALGYSTTSTGNPSCAYSPAASNGSAWDTLYYSLVHASADKLTPLVVLTTGTTIGGLPSVPTDNDYTCGLYLLMYWASYDGYHVPAWEVFNEPEGDFPGTNKNGDTGAAAAADLYIDAYWGRQAAVNAGETTDANDTLVAGAFNFASMGDNCCAYINGYLTQMDYIVQTDGYPAPGAFSGHPYDDVTEGEPAIYEGAANLQAQMDLRGFNSTPVWLTEAADWLDDPDYGSTDGNASAQTSAAQAFLEAGVVSTAARIYWYQYQSAGAGFDSALVGPDGAGRPSYCVVANLPTSDCSSHYYNQWGQTSVPAGYWGVNATSTGTYQCRYDGSTDQSGDVYTPTSQIGAAPTNTDSLDITSTTDSISTACADSWGY